MKKGAIIRSLENFIFSARLWIILVFAVITLFMAWSATHLRIDAGFSKQLPLGHEYMQTFAKHQQEFGGANRVLIALMAREGDIFTPEFFATLEQATNDVFFIPGVERAQVSSLFTPNVRFTEVVEDGIAGGNVVPADFQPTPEGLERVRQNILKAGIVGRMVASNFSGTIISAQLQDVDPNTGERLDYIKVGRLLEERIRDRYQSAKVDVHIIGFAKVMSDIADGAMRIILFFFITVAVTALLVFFYTRSLRLTLVSISCSLTAVIWQLGLLPLLGYGIDPMALLVPFLVFAIAVSHGIQMITASIAERRNGADAVEAARTSFRQLIVPGIVALVTDVIGFVTIILIKVQVIQEMAVTASLGVAVIILTDLLLLPVLLSYVRFDAVKSGAKEQAEHLLLFWRLFARLTRRTPATLIIGASLILLGLGWWKGGDIQIGDMHSGVPELRQDSRYNRDSGVITKNFAIGVDTITVIVETRSEGCMDYDIITNIDQFAWHMQNVPGVQSVISLPGVAKIINTGWNEGNLKWRVLPRNPQTMVQAVGYVPTSTGLLNPDCSVMTVMIFTRDHKAATIERIVSEVKSFRNNLAHPEVNYRLATGNVGVMAATNEMVKATQYPILLCVFGAVILLCLIQFRSLRAVLCIILPLGLVSILSYALMSILEIGLKVATLPVVSLGVGVGVDYGIYIFSRLRSYLDQGQRLEEAYLNTLAITGTGVAFTGLTLAIGVSTWIFSPLKFQADMGILLTFLFIVNMLGALIILPALASWLLPKSQTRGSEKEPQETAGA